MDSRLTSSRLRLPPDKREIRRRESLAFLRRLPELVKQYDVQVVLCPGDLWDEESVSQDTAGELFHSFARVAPIPVIIAPGNHDFYHEFSFYNAEYYKRHVGQPKPENVHIFTSPVIELLHLPELPHVDFYGCCFERNVAQTERILRDLRPPVREKALNLLLLHGSLDDRLLKPSGDKLMTFPFSREELLATGFDYVALGHYHRYVSVTEGDGRIRGAYGGIPIARGLDEIAEHYVLVGELRRGGVPPSAFHEITVDPRRIWRIHVEIDSSVMTARAAWERITAEIRRAGVDKDDIAYVELEGLVAPHIDFFHFDPEEMGSPCFHVVVDQSKLEPDYHVEVILADESAGKQVVGEFVRQMREELEQAAGEPRRQRILRAALAYGMDALHGKEIRRRYVDTDR